MIILIIFLQLLFPQKKNFGFDEIMKWQKITAPRISDDGNWVLYSLTNPRMNSELVIKDSKDSMNYKFERAVNPRFSQNYEFIAFKVINDIVAIENDKKKELKDSLFILNTYNGSIQKIYPIGKDYRISNNGEWICYFKDEGKKEKNEENALYLRHLQSSSDFFIQDVKEFGFDSTSNKLFYIKNSSSKSTNGVYFRNLKENFIPEKNIEIDTCAKFQTLSWNIDKNILAYQKRNLDSNDKVTNNQIKLWYENENKAISVADTNTYTNWYVPESNELKWNEDGTKLWYGLKPISEKIDEEDDDKKDKKIKKEEYNDFEKVLKNTKLYLWHNKDESILPYQQTNWKEEKDRFYWSVYLVQPQKNVKLADTNMQYVEFTNNDYRTLGYDFEPYLINSTFDLRYYDLYSVDLYTGERILIEKKLYFDSYIAPKSDKVVFFKDSNWISYDILSKTSLNLTNRLFTKFYNEQNDVPSPAEPYGFAGFTVENKGLFYDKYEVWEFNLDNGGGGNLLQGSGKMNKIIFRLVNLENREIINMNENIYLTAFNEKEKYQNLHIIEKGNFLRYNEGDFKFSFRAKAKNAEKYLITKEAYNLYPDLYFSDITLENPKQITNIHPEIKDYNWGTTEMVEYTNSKGDTLSGYIIKPDNFDSKKKYPLFVYFYERFSDGRSDFNEPVINHRPNYPTYIGEGYLIFLPDIKFEIGEPGKSGLDAIMSGCKKLISMGLVDSTKIALHGHSWSGYQSAYFITQTDFFTACVSGAPVSNMTSAYSGIRLGSGVARQFQYETGQSRIGGNIVDSLDAYIENSPIFYADKINTPLMIMFGDVDDAVPFSQGVEMYLACRRFNKNCILLQYENEPHHLKKFENQLDYAIKMKEYFGHYVLGKKAPDWLINGVKYQGKYNTGNK